MEIQFLTTPIKVQDGSFFRKISLTLFVPPKIRNVFRVSFFVSRRSTQYETFNLLIGYKPQSVNLFLNHPKINWKMNTTDFRELADFKCIECYLILDFNT